LVQGQNLAQAQLDKYQAALEEYKKKEAEALVTDAGDPPK
jgi:hypothetical protein